MHACPASSYLPDSFEKIDSDVHREDRILHSRFIFEQEGYYEKPAHQ